ncbi:hypothetical protein EDB81DRAFT_228929 [Dactylonectria macrodidyma]|uniref:Uncharacterized protein n=1 Tax=Dactylonectria macrodidyma TaxID=307937 RepID=A0A9P9DLG8_9HYPO|nr:hypothetical protein EDB81DRAFT_228929 [Dactylonectria macrodidyma]
MTVILLVSASVLHMMGLDKSYTRTGLRVNEHVGVVCSTVKAFDRQLSDAFFPVFLSLSFWNFWSLATNCTVLSCPMRCWVSAL